MAKKIVLVIVEGPSDDTALGMLLDNYFDPKTVKVHVVHGDITTQTTFSITAELTHRSMKMMW